MVTYLPHKALLSILCIDTKNTRCVFRNVFTGRETVQLLKVKESQIRKWAFYGVSVQYAMSDLTADERELFLTGARL